MRNVDEVIKALGLYAHNGNEKCNVMDCPNFCGSSHELGLDTSIAWCVKQLLESIRPYPHTTRTHERIISQFWIAVMRHDKKYRSLLSLIEAADTIITMKLARP